MKDRYYRTVDVPMPAVRMASPRRAQDPAGDLARAHAVNWTAAVGILTLCLGVAIWIAAKAAGVPVKAGALALVPVVALLVSGVTFGVKLVQFTEEHRGWLYAGAEQDQGDAGGQGPGDLRRDAQDPPAGAFVRGVDGALHRLDVDLSPLELQAVKRHMLVSGSFGVRAVNTILQDETRASALRVELHRLGILEAPRARVAAKLTGAGLRSVMRWP